MFKRSEEKREAAEIEKLRRYEDAAKANPKAYTRKVVAAAALGYGAPLAFVLFLLGLIAVGGLHVANGGSGAAAVVKLIIAAGVLLFMVGKSMMVTFDAPEARRVSEDEAPEFFALIDDIREKLSGPAIHEVYFDDRLNAAIEQAPRFGLFGGHINRLIIGLPLMQALTTDQLRAVIGHEYGHLAGSHGKTGAWIYRMRFMWHRLYEEMESVDGWLFAPLKVFIHRFAPWFDRLSFPLARANEYEADRAGAAVSDPQTAADALLRVTLAARFLNETLWPKIWRQANDVPTPNVAPLSAMARSFAVMPSWPRKSAWAKEELRIKTDYADTHPALKDRIKALGAKARLQKTNDPASTEILGGFYETMRKKFDAHWKEEAYPHWEASFEQAARDRKRLETLDKKAREASRLKENEAYERAVIAENVLSTDEALKRYMDAANWHPNHARAWLDLGRLLGERNDNRALSCVKRAGDIDPKLKRDAAAISHRLYSTIGEQSAAEAAADTWRTEQERHDAAMNEIYHLDKKMDFEAHDLPDEQLTPIIAVVASIEGVRDAFLIRKTTELFNGLCGYHLIVTPSSEKSFDYQTAATALQEMSFDGHLYFWFAVQDNRWLRRKAYKVEGAELNLSEIFARRAA